MATLHIDLPRELQDFVEAELAAGRYVDAADLVRDMLRDRQRARDELERLLLEGEASGISERSIDEIIDGARSRWLAHRSN